MNFKRFISSAIAAATMLTSVMTMLPTTLASADETYSIEYYRGDVNGNNAVELADAVYINQYLTGNVSSDAEALTRMDVTQDMVIDKADYNMIVKYNLNELPLEKTTTSVYNNLDNTPITYIRHKFSGEDDFQYTLYSNPELYSYPSRKMRKSPAHNGLFMDNENLNTVRIDTNYGMGTGFIVSSHVIATAAHMVCKNDNGFKFVESINLTIYDANGIGGDVIGSFSVANNNIKSVHIPKNYKTNLMKGKALQDSYDYALIYVEDDLTQYGIWSLGCITDEFKTTNSNVIVSGFTNANCTKPYERYYSTGSVVDYEQSSSLHNLKPLRMETTAYSTPGMSGGPVYYETNYFGNTVKSVVGVNTGGVGNHCEWCCRFTPTLLHFFLDNGKLI